MSTPLPASLDTLGALRRLTPDVARLVDAVDAGTWDATTPCRDFDVHHLVEHLVGGLAGFTRVAHGGSMESPFDRPGFPLQTAARSYRVAADAALDAWSIPGRLEQVFAMPWGDTPGWQLVGFLVVEQAGHGWDLARTLHLDAGFDEEAVAVADAVSRAMIDDSLRVPGMFGPEVAAPADAAPLDRLAAFLGRRP